MAPANSKANYKTYEAQARLVRAVVAAHPEVKWNYKEIVACYGSDMTEHALNHRFRRLRAQSALIREARKVGLDMKNLIEDKDLPTTQEAVDKQNIAKYFGQSTPDGIHFQFRTIKKDAKKLRDVEKNGGDVSGCLSLGGGSSAVTTPSKPTPSRSTGTGGSRKRTRVQIKRSSSDEEDEDDIGSWSDQEETPTKRSRGGALPGQKPGTPTRRAAVMASATIAAATTGLDTSSSEDHADLDASIPAIITAAPVSNSSVSIFEPIDRKPIIQPDGGGFRAGADYLAGGSEKGGAPEYNPYSELGDGEF